jgi:hypothetical protein
MPQLPPAVEAYQLRVDLARRLLHEDGFPADVRVAGLLVVLYGQHLSRIASIERENVEAHATPPRIKPGKNWLELPEPLGVRLASHGIHARAMRNTALFQLATTVQPGTLARLLDLHIGTAVDWVNKAGGVYANYWGKILDDDIVEDLDLFDPDLEALKEDDDDDPEDLLDELGIL